MGDSGLFHNLHDLRGGAPRELGPGMSARIFDGANVMLSIVKMEPNAVGRAHDHPEEQWGVLLEGDGVRLQAGREKNVAAGDFWRTPPNVIHGFRAGPGGALILDIFSPPRRDYRRRR